MPSLSAKLQPLLLGSCVVFRWKGQRDPRISLRDSASCGAGSSTASMRCFITWRRTLVPNRNTRTSSARPVKLLQTSCKLYASFSAKTRDAADLQVRCVVYVQLEQFGEGESASREMARGRTPLRLIASCFLKTALAAFQFQLWKLFPQISRRPLTEPSFATLTQSRSFT